MDLVFKLTHDLDCFGSKKDQRVCLKKWCTQECIAQVKSFIQFLKIKTNPFFDHILKLLSGG